MVGRFIDDLEFLKDSKDFSRRNDGVPLWYIAVAFVMAFMLVVSSFTLTGLQNIYLTIFIIATCFATLLLVVLYYMQKERKIVAVVELQNAIFSGAAQMVTELCIILRQDGRVVYISPEYKRKILKENDEKNINLSSLVKAGAISKIDKEKLEASLLEGKTTQVTFYIPDGIDEKNMSAFSLHPIGVYPKNDRVKGLRLATQPIARPSGYFLLEAPKENKKLIEENRKYSVLKNFPIGFYSLKKNHDFKEIGGNLEVILGYQSGEIQALSLSFKELFYDYGVLSNLLKKKDDWQVILMLRSKENMLVPALVCHRVVKSKQGTVLRSYGVVMPFEETAISGLGTSSSSENLDIVNNSPIATAVLDVMGQIQTSNKSFKQIVKKKNQVGNVSKLQDVITFGEDYDIEKLLKGLATGQIENVPPVDVKITGVYDETASLYLSRITGKYGGFDGIIAHLIDTTELKNLEMRFVHSQKMQAVGQLAGGIAHDFNNLLTAMMGFCDLLLMKHPAGDTSFADIMQIKQNANRAANLVRQLLAFSRKQTLQPEIINITDVLADLSNLIGRLIGENIELNMEYGSDIGNVKVDKGQLEQVIVNLAVNARDAMPDGGVLSIKTSNIKIDAKTKLSKSLIPPSVDDVIEIGDYVLVEVIDTGTGMEKEQIGKIFEPFYSTKPVGAGTGLGLSTVYGIIKQTDGYVYVSSKVGKGTNFSIFLKRHAVTTQRENDKEIAEKAATTDISGVGTILLVEDETPVRIFSKSALSSKGYNVLETDSAEAALEIFKKKSDKIDIIVTDVVMPGMTGPDMMEEIAKIRADVKVVFVSGYGEDAFIETYGMERKFNFLSKPYTLKQLATKVKEVLESE